MARGGRCPGCSRPVETDIPPRNRSRSLLALRRPVRHPVIGSGPMEALPVAPQADETAVRCVLLVVRVLTTDPASRRSQAGQTPRFPQRVHESAERASGAATTCMADRLHRLRDGAGHRTCAALQSGSTARGPAASSGLGQPSMPSRPASAIGDVWNPLASAVPQRVSNPHTCRSLGDLGRNSVCGNAPTAAHGRVAVATVDTRALNQKHPPIRTVPRLPSGTVPGAGRPWMPLSAIRSARQDPCGRAAEQIRNVFTLGANPGRRANRSPEWTHTIHR